MHVAARARHGGALLLVWLCLLLACGAARALSPDRDIAHFSYVWYENQLPQGTVLAITQQANGALWMATYGGLVRHSGEGFEAIDPRVAPALRSSSITTVADDGQDGLWVGTLNGGLYRYRGHALAPVDLPAGIESVFGIVPDGAGGLWLTTNAGVVRMVEGQPRLLGDAEGFPPRGFYRAIVADAAGGVWIAADGVGVVHWTPQGVRLYDHRDGLPSNAVYSLSVDAAGTPWVGTQDGPAYFADGRFQRDPQLAPLAGKRIYTLFGDRAGTVWFAPLGMGLCRLVRGVLSCDDTLPGLQGETVRSMFEDHEGSLWIGTTSSGVQRLSQSKLVTVLGPGPSNAVRAVHPAPDGTLWVGTDGGGLSRYVSPRLVPATALNAHLPSQLVRAILTDDRGRLWVAGTEGVTRFGPAGRVRNFGLADGLPGTIVFAFAPASAGGMWVGTLQGVVRIEEDRVHMVEPTRGDDIRALYEAPDGTLWIGLRSGLRCWRGGMLDRCGTDGLPGTSVFAFHRAANGDMWLGTSVGIMRLRGRQVSRFLGNAGFHGDSVFVLLDDGHGNFWFSSNRGIGRVVKADLEALAAGRRVQVTPQWFGTADGMLNAQGNGASQTPAARTADGRMWFGTARGLVVVDPRWMQGNARPPPVAVERLLADGEEVDLDALRPLGPGVQRVEIHFAGMSYVAPSAVRYRYRLEGFDGEWREAGGNRRAYYTNLPPGDYVFHVTASNNDGVWNERGDVLAFRLQPQWYQTWWTRGLVLLALLAAITAMVRWRLAAAGQRERQLTEEVARRTEDLHEANRQLARIASQDALTGIANRRAFNQALLQAWEEQAAAGGRVAVLLADVDAFKAYNDTHGHLAGDAVLAAVARQLAAPLALPGQLAARYGGEEFAVLLPGMDCVGAGVMAERIRQAIQAGGLPHRASPVGPVVTVSIGVACACPGPETPPESLLQAADRALYRAKDGGRNRVVCDDC